MMNVGATGALESGAEPASLKGLFSEAWGMLKRNYGPLVLLSLVYLLISFGAGMVPLVGSIAAILLMPMTVGFLYAGRRLALGQEVRIESLFVAFNKQQYVQVLCIQFLVSLIVGAVFLPILVGFIAIIVLGASGLNPGPGVALLVLLILASSTVSLYLVSRLMFSGLLFLEAPAEEFDPIRAIRKSWELTGPCQWMLFGKVVVLALLGVASVFTLFAGHILLVMPLTVCTIGAAMGRISPRRAGVCGKCGYSRAGLESGPCPECGAPAEGPSG